MPPLVVFKRKIISKGFLKGIIVLVNTKGWMNQNGERYARMGREMLEEETEFPFPEKKSAYHEFHEKGNCGCQLKTTHLRKEVGGWKLRNIFRNL